MERNSEVEKFPGTLRTEGSGGGCEGDQKKEATNQPRGEGIDAEGERRKKSVSAVRGRNKNTKKRQVYHQGNQSRNLKESGAGGMFAGLIKGAGDHRDTFRRVMLESRRLCSSRPVSWKALRNPLWVVGSIFSVRRARGFRGGTGGKKTEGGRGGGYMIVSPKSGWLRIQKGAEPVSRKG